jgi:hypothetical protein
VNKAGQLADAHRNMEFIVDRESGRMLGGTTSDVWKRAERAGGPFPGERGPSGLSVPLRAVYAASSINGAGRQQ